MSRNIERTLVMVIIGIGIVAVALLPLAAQASDVSISIPPGKPVIVEPGDCEVAIQPVPGPCDNPPVFTPPVEPPVFTPPVEPPVFTPPVEPPVSGEPDGRVWQIRLWIHRRGEGFSQTLIPCSEDCPIAERLVRASRFTPSRNCQPRRGSILAGGWWQGQRIGPFHNHNTCRAGQWRKVAAIYNDYLPR